MLDQANYNLSGLSDQTVSNLHKLADFMEADKVYGFNMNSIHQLVPLDDPLYPHIELNREHYCGTAGCIAGYVMFLNNNTHTSMEEAGESIGLPHGIWDNLFYAIDTTGANRLSHSFSSITRAVAVKAIRILASTGQVNFTRAKQELAEEKVYE